MAPKQNRISWAPIIKRAREIVFVSERAMTLRQLFYRLVAEELIANAEYPYKYLSRLTARGRRDGSFPRLVDPTRQVYLPRSWSSPHAAAEWLVENYRRDRAEGQSVNLIVAVEKATQFGFLASWFDELGVPVVALRGYSSQSQVESVIELVEFDPRPAVLVYAGDYDPSGDDILRDFTARGPLFAEVRRVALDWSQVIEFGLPPQLGKATDSRAAAFAEREGHLVQVELEALPAEVLGELYQAAIDEFWDGEAFERVLDRERREDEQLAGWVSDFEEES